MDWNVHDENVTILGMQGSGKTTLAKRLLDTIPAVPRLVFSPQGPLSLYGQYGQPIDTVEEIEGGRALLWTGETDPRTFAAICNRIMELSNIVMVVDDAHEQASKQKMPPEWGRLISSGRNRGITSIFISPAPSQMHNVLMQSSAILYSFRFALESQIEYARKNFFGEAAYLLMPAPARPPKYAPWPELPKHDYLARHVSAAAVEWHSADGEVWTVEARTLEGRTLTRQESPEEPPP